MIMMATFQIAFSWFLLCYHHVSIQAYIPNTVTKSSRIASESSSKRRTSKLLRTCNVLQPPSFQCHHNAATSTSLYALTERQMQFWEDVEQGLSDIETVYPPSQTQSESQRPNLNSMDRIRTFAQTAQGILPPPLPSAPGHQPSPEHMPGLTAQPFWDITSNAIQFPWASKLEENWHIIRQELDAKLENEARAAALAKQQQQQQTLGGGKNSIFSGDSAWQNNVMGAGWSAFRLQRLGVWNGDNCQQFPQTTELLRSLDIPFAVRGVCFARQQAMSGVQPHSDGRNFILTSHLGLKIPKGCWMKVGEETRGWEEGKLTTLDTSFEHSTGNPSEEDRHVLIIDFWHPELTEVEIKALEFVYDLRNKFESGQVPFRKPRRILEQEKKKKMEQGLGLAGMWNGLFSKK